MDRDVAAVADALRRTATEAGVSQGRFARALGTSPSRWSTYVSGSVSPSAALYLRALRCASGLSAARRDRRMTPFETVDEMRRALGDGDEDWALRMVTQARDHLRWLLDSGNRDAWEVDPGSCGDRRWDVLLAALTSHEYVRVGLSCPGWAAGARLDEPWTMPTTWRSPQEVRDATPDWLADRGIYATERDLATA